jgi:hypothetical protein
VGSPAFLLLLAFGVWAIWELAARPAGARRAAADKGELTGRAGVASHGAPRMNPLALVPLGLLLIGSLFALVNLYTNPAYVKDDFRAIVRFIETRAGNRDVIVYNNAVLLPLHEHYRLRDDIAVTALPAYPQFATGDGTGAGRAGPRLRPRVVHHRPPGRQARRGPAHSGLARCQPDRDHQPPLPGADDRGAE